MRSCSLQAADGGLTSERGAAALLDMATLLPGGSGLPAAPGMPTLSFTTRARAISAVFKLLPASSVASLFQYGFDCVAAAVAAPAPAACAMMCMV